VLAGGFLGGVGGILLAGAGGVELAEPDEGRVAHGLLHAGG
jgi:hypothetical protein